MKKESIAEEKMEIERKEPEMQPVKNIGMQRPVKVKWPEPKGYEKFDKYGAK